MENKNFNMHNSDVKLVATRDGFGKGLLELAEQDSNVVVLTADLSESTKVEEFENKYPERFVECGVAEQNMMGIAAGLALSGKIPFLTSYATFSPGRNWDQLRVSVCYSRANVKIIGHHTGLGTGPDGATHQALEDIAITRVLPNLTVVVPCDFYEAKRATIAIGKLKGSAYLRLNRQPTAILTSQDTPFEIGKAYTMLSGSDVVIIGSGWVLYYALLAAEELKKEKISVMVVNNHTIKPIDAKSIISAAKKCGAVVTVEDHQVTGGAGSAVAEVLAKNFPVPIEMVGMQDTFGESGKPEELIEKYGLGKDAIIKAVKKVFARK